MNGLETMEKNVGAYWNVGDALEGDQKVGRALGEAWKVGEE